MKSTGIIRRIDYLGRIIIPKEIRAKLSMKEGEPLEVQYDKNGVFFKRYDPNANITDYEKVDWASEYAYILSFIKENADDDNTVCTEQLRALWTAFCLHQNIDVDTGNYDNAMLEIWEYLQKTNNSLCASFDYEKFYNAMSEYLV